MVISFLSMGGTITAAQYCFGLFVEPLHHDFGWSRTEISASLSFVAVGSLFGPLLGRLMDKYGARPILVGSCLLTGSAFLLRPFMTELWHWYALSFLQFAAFSGCTMLPAGRLIGLWFTERRGRMMGLTAAGPNVMGMFMPALVVTIIAASGWKSAYVALGLMMFVIAAAGQLFIREPDYGDKIEGTKRRASIGGYTAKQALRSPLFYSLTFAVILAFFTYGTVLPHVINHLTSQGITPGRAAGALGLLALFGTLGKVSFGFLAEKVTARKSYAIDLFGQAVFTYLLATSDGSFLLWIAVPMYGFFLGGVGSLAPLVIQEAFGLKHFGAIMGWSSLATVISFAAGPLLAGWSFDSTGSYDQAFIVAAGAFLLGAIIFTISKPKNREPEINS